MNHVGELMDGQQKPVSIYDGGYRRRQVPGNAPRDGVRVLFAPAGIPVEGRYRAQRRRTGIVRGNNMVGWPRPSACKYGVGVVCPMQRAQKKGRSRHTSQEHTCPRGEMPVQTSRQGTGAEAANREGAVRRFIRAVAPGSGSLL